MAVIPTFHYEVQRIATQDIAPVVFIFSAYLFDERPIWAYGIMLLGFIILESCILY